ncbi:MAG: hypothetical protein CL840_10895 [Crocinitomicaceae bacterium]|nr:hypothetical protein [Crocinitomicaceae bacterium]|tara:strand:+ start:6410 stop:7057 length:648 start_codon:yes stop_codon:yes gene_type:complete
MTVYQISGLGAGKEVFGKIKLEHPTVFIPWLIPEKNESIASYAKRMAKDINTSEPFSLMGVSFGGIMIQEIGRFLNPEKKFVISSVQYQSEIPLSMRATAKLGLSKRIPSRGLMVSKGVTSYLFGAKKKSEKEWLNEIIGGIDMEYLRWSLTQIGIWKGNTGQNDIVRIHGKKDLLFPARKLKKVDYWLRGGHLAAITDGAEISKIINSSLKAYD